MALTVPSGPHRFFRVQTNVLRLHQAWNNQHESCRLELNCDDARYPIVHTVRDLNVHSVRWRCTVPAEIPFALWYCLFECHCTLLATQTRRPAVSTGETRDTQSALEGLVGYRYKSRGTLLPAKCRQCSFENCKPVPYSSEVGTRLQSFYNLLLMY